MKLIVSLLLLGSAAVLLAQEDSFGVTLGGSSSYCPYVYKCQPGKCPWGYWCHYTRCGSKCVPIRPHVRPCEKWRPMVHCYVDPCQYATCSIPYARCRSCYHGGCRAIWYVGHRIVNC